MSVAELSEMALVDWPAGDCWGVAKR